jgi:hypothetical protein
MLYTAIIIEPRQHKALPFVLENFLNNLSEDWSFIIFHGTTNLNFIIDIINDKLSSHLHRIKLINLNVKNLTINAYNNLLKYNKSFYDYIPTETFLIFQTDSIIFKQYKHFINNYLTYDYAGAPFYFNKHKSVGNGGLSLRKKSKMIEIMSKEGKNNHPEDVYFSCCESVSIHKPSINDAMLFSVEEIFSEMSFGCHKPWININELYLYEKYDEVRQLYSYNDILPPKPIVIPAPAAPPPPPPPKPIVVPASALPPPPPPPKPIVVPAPAALPPPPPPPKPIVVPAPAALPPPPPPKPIVVPAAAAAAAPPPPPPPKAEVISDSSSKGYKIAHIEKEKLKEMYNYQNFKYNNVSSSSSKTTTTTSTAQVNKSNSNNSINNSQTQEQNAIKTGKINLTSLSSNFQHKFQYK